MEKEIENLIRKVKKCAKEVYSEFSLSYKQLLLFGFDTYRYII